jgi:hypothetical protein
VTAFGTLLDHVLGLGHGEHDGTLLDHVLGLGRGEHELIGFAPSDQEWRSAPGRAV